MSVDMFDREWSVLEPTARQRQRIDSQVFEWLGAHDTSLASEWLGFLKVRPIVALGYAAAATVSLIALTPLGWLTASILR